MAIPLPGPLEQARQRARKTKSQDEILAEANNRYLVEALEENKDILPAPALFLAIREQLDPGALDVQFKAIKGAGDAVGDFYFVPRS